MKYRDLRDFIAQLEQQGELKRVKVPVDTRLEMTEICDRVLRAEGPAILFEKPVGPNGEFTIPVLANLFGTPRRVAMGMGQDSVSALREVGTVLSMLKEPEPPKGLKDAWEKFPLFKQVLNMAPKVLSSAPCQEVVWEGDAVDLSRLPIQHCWPGDVAPLITWGLTITRGPFKKRQNLGIYRQQVIGHNKLIMRWLAHRGGALDYRDHCQKNPGQPYPVAVALGADPATILGAVTPVPDSLSEYQFAGLLRGAKTELIKCIGNDLQVPASAEIFVPLLQKQFPEIVDFYLPPEGCSYRLAVVSIKKQYPGHAKRVMFGIWSFLRQFMYTKFIIVVDDDVNIRDWKEVIWALTTRMDATRDTTLVDNTPIDYLDFASPVAGLGSKMGLDATNKWPGETSREWGRPIVMDEAVKTRVDELWQRLGL